MDNTLIFFKCIVDCINRKNLYLPVCTTRNVKNAKRNNCGCTVCNDHIFLIALRFICI